MKKTLIVLCLAAAVLSFSACAKKEEGRNEAEKVSKEAEWKYEKKIVEPIKKVSDGENDITLGNLEENAVMIAIPKGSFDGQTEVELKTPESVPNYIASEMDPVFLKKDVLLEAEKN